MFQESLGLKATKQSDDSQSEKKNPEAVTKKSEKSGGFNFDIMDFSEIFPFAASLLNCFHVSISNVNINLKSGTYSSFSSFH